jgi:tRNA nucleotidyltransferase (CCA-adding enzyme)
LRRPVADLDLAVEGDAVRFGRALARKLGADLRVHERFGTATLELGDGSRLDLASTREERYDSRGALPRVAPAPLAKDLERRDFTVNAMALRIAPGRTALLDPFGGLEDLAGRRIRMLHAGSPHDDPTRAFRAVRYANRLGFAVDSTTRRWIGEALRAGAFDEVSGDRLRRELRLLFSEENRAEAARWMSRLGLDRAVDPGLSFGPETVRSFRRAEKLAARHAGRTDWFLYLLVWAGPLDETGAARLARRLSFAGEQRARLAAWPSTLATLRRNPTHAAASRFGADEIAAAAVLAGPAGRRLERVLASLGIELSIRGRDLIAAGVPPGPHIGRALEAALEARRAGQISREKELEFAVGAAGEAS